MKLLASKQQGFSFVEVLVSMSLFGGSILFLAQLMLTGLKINSVSRDETILNGLANDRMEQLKNMNFDDLGTPCINANNLCGSLTANITDTTVTPNVPYFDNSNANYTIRWTISTSDGVNPLPAGTKRISVRAISNGLRHVGNQRDLTIYFDKIRL
jgi:prepilin-type N-terminal cleavage/methylation domain-containing protein